MIIIESYNEKLFGFGVKQEVLLFADTKTEVPSTGVATRNAMGGTFALPPTSIIHTAAGEVAVLDTNDNWVWKE